MSRQRINMQDGRLLVIGYDAPNSTWFALVYDERDSDMCIDEDAPPCIAIGYSPDERAILLAERPDAKVGSFPVADDDLEHMLSVELHELGGDAFKPAEKQSMCWTCHRPPWQRNDECANHAFGRLRAA